MLETQACTNTRYMVQREPKFEHDSNVSVLSSDDESTPSETTLDDICESMEGPTQDLLGCHSHWGNKWYPPFGFDRIRDVQQNSSSIGFGNAMGKFQGVIGTS